jgi:hypothetical protein
MPARIASPATTIAIAPVTPFPRQPLDPSDINA